MSLNIISLNVNGIIEKAKRQAIFQWLRKKNANVCLLQETHCENDEDVNKWSREWGGESYWSFGTNFSRGVAILIQENLDIKASNIEKDKDGRFISIILKIDECSLQLILVCSK